MKTETMQQTENVIADVHTQTEGGQPPSHHVYTRIRNKSCFQCKKYIPVKSKEAYVAIFKIADKDIFTCFCNIDCLNNFSKTIEKTPVKKYKYNIYFTPYCFECNKKIKNWNKRSKIFCNDCIKKHIKNCNESFLAQNPEYEKNRYIKRKTYHKLYREKHQEERTKYNRERRWRLAEEQDIFVEHVYDIDNCIICGQDISMYDSNAKLCVHCQEKHLHELGTIDFSSHMRRKYDHTIHEVVPDYKKEQKAIDAQMRACGLKIGVER